MWRHDREVTDPARIRAVIESCSCCRLGLRDGEDCYVVPMSFGYAEENGQRRFYFHSAKEGRKLDLIRRTHRAGFELDCGYQLHESAVACKNSAAFRSVIGTGHVEFVTGREEKRAALCCILRHTTGKADWTLPEGAEESVCIFRLDVETLCCKEHL